MWGIDKHCSGRICTYNGLLIYHGLASVYKRIHATGFTAVHGIMMCLSPSHCSPTSPCSHAPPFIACLCLTISCITINKMAGFRYINISPKVHLPSKHTLGNRTLKRKRCTLFIPMSCFDQKSKMPLQLLCALGIVNNLYLLCCVPVSCMWLCIGRLAGDRWGSHGSKRGGFGDFLGFDPFWEYRQGGGVHCHVQSVT